MRLFEKEFEVPLSDGCTDLIGHFARAVDSRLRGSECALRFAVTFQENGAYHCESALLDSQLQSGNNAPDSIFRLHHRSAERSDDFNCVLIVPTGIGAEIGGHAGDAGPVARLLASCCDTLITHPNVVNASDINELPDNGLYVEGSTLTRLLMGTVGLRRTRSNRLLVLLDSQREPVFTHAAINAVNGARTAYGLDCQKIVGIDPPLQMISRYTSTGTAAGEVLGLERVCEILDAHIGQFDAVAISTVIDVPRHYHTDYFKSGGEMVNPWGGVEAMLTHVLSLLYNVPVAHAPMFESQEVANEDPGVVDPRMAAEAVSVTFMQSLLKGLMRAPRIVTAQAEMSRPEVLTVADVSCVVVPDGCLGLPTLAALEQGIPLIGVRENRNRMRNDLAALPWQPGQFRVVENYWEAVGVLAAMRAGIDPASVRRPARGVAVEIPQATAVQADPELSPATGPGQPA